MIAIWKIFILTHTFPEFGFRDVDIYQTLSGKYLGISPTAKVKNNTYIYITTQHLFVC